MKTARTSRMVRATLLASAAGFCLSLAAGSAQAATDDPITDGTLTRPLLGNTVRESQSGGQNAGFDVVREAQLSGPTALPTVQPDPQIVIANPPAAPGQTPNSTVTDRDPVNITGIGQMIVDQQNGFIGLCTGTLINPRTVIFAAHCVNEDEDTGDIIPATTYGNASGGRPIAFGFSNSNNTPGNSAFGHYLTTGNTNVADWLYNVNQVRYNPLSVEPDAEGFLYGDIALASFDTPTKNIPTWALLFSALPARDLGAAGTGYHVVIEGYGNNGVASTGSTTIDYRRRLAENMIGGLASLDEFENFLFGGNSTVHPQNLYWTDFDDPRRGQAGASGFDFNAWRDNAVPGTSTRPSQEGTTASGDSGGPLILDNTYAKAVVIATLSGGYTRFFNGQPANGYGTASFYQPLYLYWDWIAQNNPYHYVGAVGGNGNWTDPTHWVTNIDPAYQILTLNAQGQLVLVNGVPTLPGTGNTDTPGFGEACFQSGNVSDCLNIATGTETVDGPNPPHPIGTSTDVPGDVGNDRGNVTSGSLSGGGAASQAVGGGSGGDGSQSSSGSQSPDALPLPTLTNGLPGATNFVPNNIDPVRTTGAIGRYFDVTLTAAGTTTLDTAVTIDRFSIGIGGGNAVLDVKSTGSLTSLLDITQATGTIHANGLINTPGDYMMVSGGLDGTGTVTAAFFTSVAGTIAPGTAGTVGTLNFKGNLVLASASTYNLDLGASGTSDKIAVAANGAGTGLANLGGRLVLNSTAATLRGGNTYTILTSAGGISGKFIDPGAFSAILTPKLTYTANAVTLQIAVGKYGNVIDVNNPIQYSYALLLDRNRGQAGSYDALYGPLDLQNQATIRSTLTSLAPTTEAMGQSLAIAGVDNWSSLIRDRVGGMQLGDAGGTLARYGAPTQVASNGINAMNMGGMSAMGFGADVRSDTQQPLIQENALPDSVNGFLAGGYLTGDSAAMTGILGRDTYTGWYAAGGLETSDDTSSIGIAFSYTRLDGTGALPGQVAHGNLFQGSLYGKMNLGGATLDAIVTAGLVNLQTARNVVFVGTPYKVISNANSLVGVSEVGLSKEFDIGSIRVTPRIAGRAEHIDFSRTAERNGPMALMIDRGPLNSVQARGSLTIAGTGTVKPFLSGSLVHDFMDRPAVLGANFVGGVGGNVLFALNGQDKDWAEVSGGLTYETGNFSLSASAETTIERQDVSSQAYRGSISIKF